MWVTGSGTKYWPFVGIAIAAVAACATATSEPTTSPELAGAAPTPITGSPSAATSGTSAPHDTTAPTPTGTEGRDAPLDSHDTEPTPTFSATVSGGQDQQSPWLFVSERLCGDGPLFSAFPMDLDKVTNINPLGNLGPPGHTFPTSHMYFGVPVIRGEVGEGPFGDGQVFPPTPVYAMADSELVFINVSTVTTSLSGQEVTYEEYGFDIAVCEGLRVRYGHVGPVSDRILESFAGLEGFNCNAYSTGSFAVDSCTYSPDIEFVAGEQLGFNSGRSAALDIGAFDINTETIDFLHPELVGEEARGAVCVLDLYSDDQRSAMLQLLGDNNGLRTADPICGVLNYTVAGTLQGNWFNEIETFTQEDKNIAFVYDEVLPEVPVISIGFVPGIESYAHRFTPLDEGRINLPFIEVEAGAGVYCYQDFVDDFGRPGPNTHLLVEVPEAGRLLAQAVDGRECGAGPWQLGPEATEFVR